MNTWLTGKEFAVLSMLGPEIEERYRIAGSPYGIKGEQKWLVELDRDKESATAFINSVVTTCKDRVAYLKE